MAEIDALLAEQFAFDFEDFEDDESVYDDDSGYETEYDSEPDSDSDESFFDEENVLHEVSDDGVDEQVEIIDQYIPQNGDITHEDFLHEMPIGVIEDLDDEDSVGYVFQQMHNNYGESSNEEAEIIGQYIPQNGDFTHEDFLREMPIGVIEDSDDEDEISNGNSNEYAGVGYVFHQMHNNYGKSSNEEAKITGQYIPQNGDITHEDFLREMPIGVIENCNYKIHDYTGVGAILQKLLNNYGKSSDEQAGVSDSNSDDILDYNDIGEEEISHHGESDHTQDDAEYEEDIDDDDILRRLCLNLYGNTYKDKLRGLLNIEEASDNVMIDGSSGTNTLQDHQQPRERNLKRKMEIDEDDTPKKKQMKFEIPTRKCTNFGRRIFNFFTCLVDLYVNCY